MGNFLAISIGNKLVEIENGTLSELKKYWKLNHTPFYTTFDKDKERTYPFFISQ